MNYSELSNATLYSQIRQELEELNEYHLLLQEQGLLTDDIYFGRDEETEACRLSYPNDLGRFTGFSSVYATR